MFSDLFRVCAAGPVWCLGVWVVFTVPGKFDLFSCSLVWLYTTWQLC